jgi:NAD(P)-dependent dehydrogenase (short-subunit alcohol dehydrogenase family)
VGRQGLAYWGAFAAAKFGIEGLMQTLAEETRDQGQLRVNSLDPGIVRTGLRARLYPGETLADLAAPESITSRYLYLLGPESRGVTGQARLSDNSEKLLLATRKHMDPAIFGFALIVGLLTSFGQFTRGCC